MPHMGLVKFLAACVLIPAWFVAAALPGALLAAVGLFGPEIDSPLEQVVAAATWVGGLFGLAYLAEPLLARLGD